MRRHLALMIAALVVCGCAAGAMAADAAATVSHEFRYKPDANSTARTINLAGDFNDWSTTATPMERAADGTYSVTTKLTPGKHFYKFVLNGTTWINDPAADKSLEEDDGQQGKNSGVVISATDKAADGKIEHTFSYHPTDDPAPKAVNLAGEFNSWSTTASPMTRGDDGNFTLKLKLAPGSYQYKFVLDGTKWLNDPAADKSLDKPDGNGGANSVVVIK